MKKNCLWPNKLKHMSLGPIQIGLTDKCNFNCIMCVQHDQNETIKNRFMKKEAFFSIIDDLKSCEIPICSIVLQWYGESLLHPDFNEILEYIAISEPEKWLGGISLSTNGALFTEEIGISILKISKLIPFTIVFSIDALTEKTFYKIKKNNCLPKVIVNIRNFLKLRKEYLNKDNSRVMIQFLVLEENKDEGIDFIKFWKNEFSNIGETVEIKANAYNIDEYKNIINIKTAEISDNIKQMNINRAYENIVVNSGIVPLYEMKQKEKEVFELIDSKNNSKVENNIRKPCWSMFFSPSIQFDGNVTVCCSDNLMKLSLGNIYKEKLSKIWMNKKAQIMRKIHLNGEFKKIPYCDNCNCYAYGKYHTLSDDEIDYFNKLYKSSYIKLENNITDNYSLFFKLKKERKYKKALKILSKFNYNTNLNLILEKAELLILTKNRLRAYLLLFKVIANIKDKKKRKYAFWLLKGGNPLKLKKNNENS